MIPKGIKYVSLFEHSGYSESATRCLRALIAQGVPVTWTPMVPGRELGLWYQPFLGTSIGDPELDPICNRDIDYDTVIVHSVPEYFPYWRTVEHDATLIGYTAWETDRLPKAWPQLLSQMDQIWVPSQWCVPIFEEADISVPVAALPHIALEPSGHTNREPAPESSLSAVRANDFIFYSINAWNARKALPELIHSYLNTFTAEDAVALVIKTSKDDHLRSHNWLIHRLQNILRPNTQSALAKLLKAYSNPARVLLYNDNWSNQEISALHQRGDCYVSLSHGEAWGIGAFDACSYGKPVIMTGCGGQLEYLTPDYPYLCDYELVPVVTAAGFESYASDQHWAQADSSSAAQRMAQVFLNREQAAAVGRQAQQRVYEQFSGERVVARLLGLIHKEAMPAEMNR